MRTCEGIARRWRWTCLEAPDIPARACAVTVSGNHLPIVIGIRCQTSSTTRSGRTATDQCCWVMLVPKYVLDVTMSSSGSPPDQLRSMRELTGTFEALSAGYGLLGLYEAWFVTTGPYSSALA